MAGCCHQLVLGCWRRMGVPAEKLEATHVVGLGIELLDWEDCDVIRSMSNLVIMGNQLYRSCSNHLVYCGEQVKLRVVPLIRVVMPSKIPVEILWQYSLYFWPQNLRSHINCSAYSAVLGGVSGGREPAPHGAEFGDGVFSHVSQRSGWMRNRGLYVRVWTSIFMNVTMVFASPRRRSMRVVSTPLVAAAWFTARTRAFKRLMNADARIQAARRVLSGSTAMTLHPMLAAKSVKVPWSPWSAPISRKTNEMVSSSVFYGIINAFFPFPVHSNLMFRGYWSTWERTGWTETERQPVVGMQRKRWQGGSVVPKTADCKCGELYFAM